MKKTRFSLVLLLSLLLSACSSSFVYNNLDWLLYWYVDDYIELTAEQKALLDERIDSWHAWHRSVELKTYRTQLNTLRAQLQKGTLDQKQWLQVFNEVQQSVQRLRDKIAPELAVLAPQLSTSQLEDFLSEWQKNREERQSRVAAESKEERLADRQEDLTERVEENIGKLTPEQRQILQRYVPQFMSTFELRMAYQTRLQKTIKDLFVNKNSPQFPQQLSDIITNPEQYKTPQHKAASEHNKALYAQMLADLNTSLTEEQQQTLDNKLQEWLQFLNGLI
ncbi:DUF6279 family lipoprotein [Marinomonas posidonica]|uniref:Lipoprotein n=1 Tax=Marinomonas posidonica (strain CECT 7376 / NCIMB 14433 / IVIA-Po-181) TaxID=491952 RepID=F6CSM9_MARPP|nr:DUF6279 family lipoprotein [Marinomonas posidonica]AEF56187.1 hypothetical protein Mar181_3163 [Marinomonas posidonica IVIA-Po-181]